jgi:hypothetical protein
MGLSKFKRVYFYYVICGLMGLCFACASYATAPQKTPSALVAARKNLRISQATEKRIASELERLKKSGEATPEVITDYEIYLDRVRAMVAENQKIVRDMEATYARYVPEASTSGSASVEDKDAMLDPDIPEQQTVDEVAALDRELDQSLSAFDELLLKELDLIRAKSADKMQDLAQEAAEAARRLKEKGIDLEGSSSEDTAESEAEETADQKETDTGETDAETETGASGHKDEQAQKEGSGDDQTRKGDTSREGGEGKTRPQDRHGSGEDDDIVARQLREAAEKETDPELKEKLWKEYDEYKKNTGG